VQVGLHRDQALFVQRNNPSFPFGSRRSEFNTCRCRLQGQLLFLRGLLCPWACQNMLARSQQCLSKLCLPFSPHWHPCLPHVWTRPIRDDAETQNLTIPVPTLRQCWRMFGYGITHVRLFYDKEEVSTWQHSCCT